MPARSPYDNLVHPRTVKKPVPSVEAEKDLVVEDPSSGFVGAVVRCEKDVVHLEDRFGKVRGYPLGPGFWVDGRPVVLVRPKPQGPVIPTRSASGTRSVLLQYGHTAVRDSSTSSKAPPQRWQRRQASSDGVIGE